MAHQLHSPLATRRNQNNGILSHVLPPLYFTNLLHKPYRLHSQLHTNIARNYSIKDWFIFYSIIAQHYTLCIPLFHIFVCRFTVNSKLQIIIVTSSYSGKTECSGVKTT